MASLLRTRIVPRLAQVIVASRPLVARPMMASSKKVDVSEQLADLLNNMSQQTEKFEELQEQVGELQEQVQELEEENTRLRARVGDDEDEDDEVSSGKIDRDALEEKLSELEEALESAQSTVEEIRSILQ